MPGACVCVSVYMVRVYFVLVGVVVCGEFGRQLTLIGHWTLEAVFFEFRFVLRLSRCSPSGGQGPRVGGWAVAHDCEHV